MKVEIFCVAILGILCAVKANEGSSSPCTEEKLCNEEQKRPFPDNEKCFLVTYTDNSTDYVNFESECRKLIDACERRGRTEYNLSLPEMCDGSSWNEDGENPSDDAEVVAIVEELKI